MAATPLEITVLALLNERDMHPYEMYQLLLQRRADRIVKLRPGSLYHTVARLDRDRLVTAIGTERDGNRPERTTYAITPAGRIALEEQVAEMLEQSVREHPQFPLALAEAHNLDRDAVVRRLAGRIRLLEQDLAQLDSDCAALVDMGKSRAYWIELEYLRSVRLAEIEWLRRTVDELRSGELAWVTTDIIKKRLVHQPVDRAVQKAGGAS